MYSPTGTSRNIDPLDANDRVELNSPSESTSLPYDRFFRARGWLQGGGKLFRVAPAATVRRARTEEETLVLSCFPEGLSIGGHGTLPSPAARLMVNGSTRNPLKP